MHSLIAGAIKKQALLIRSAIAVIVLRHTNICVLRTESRILLVFPLVTETAVSSLSERIRLENSWFSLLKPETPKPEPQNHNPF